MSDQTARMGHQAEEGESIVKALLGLMKPIGGHTVGTIESCKNMSGLLIARRVLRESNSLPSGATIGQTRRVVVKDTT